MTLFRRLVGAAIVVVAASHVASAQTAPAKPVRILVPCAVGSPPDLVARILAKEMSEISGQQTYVENFTAGENCFMDIPITTLSVWISAQTGLSMGPPPRIEFISPPRMSEIALGPNIAPNPQLRALYNRKNATIYLRANWNSTSLNDQSELVHELVHHFQKIHDLPYQCDAARETLAYDLQVKWLKEQGVDDPYHLLQINHFFIVMTSVCRDANFD